MICDDSDNYEFHISAKEGSNLEGIDTNIKILDDYNRTKNYTLHQEPHDADICQPCGARGLSASGVINAAVIDAPSHGH